MSASPTPAQADAARRDLRGSLYSLPDADAAALDALRSALAARHAPADAVEERWVEEFAFAMWRQKRLRILEAAALAHAEVGTNEPDAPRPLSLATLARYRARVERDLRLAGEALAAAKRARPRLPAAALEGASAPRLRWLAERLEARAAAANDDGGEGTNGPEPAGTRVAATPPHPAGTKEPKPADPAGGAAPSTRLARCG